MFCDPGGSLTQLLNWKTTHNIDYVIFSEAVMSVWNASLEIADHLVDYFFILVMVWLDSWTGKSHTDWSSPRQLFLLKFRDISASQSITFTRMPEKRAQTPNINRSFLISLCGLLASPQQGPPHVCKADNKRGANAVLQLQKITQNRSPWEGSIGNTGRECIVTVGGITEQRATDYVLEMMMTQC